MGTKDDTVSRAKVPSASAKAIAARFSKDLSSLNATCHLTTGILLDHSLSQFWLPEH
jgi:hypothetical protein